MRSPGSILAATFLAAALALGPQAFADSTERRAIDVAKSRAQFSITHVFVECVTGTLPLVSGTLTVPMDSTIPSSASALLDASLLTTGDRDQTDALRSPDFFDTKRFPTWTFTSTKVTPHGAAAFGMDGLLTLHGVTQPEHLEVTVQGDGAHVRYHAVARVDRHAFGMPVTRLDPAIGETADVTLDIALI